MLIDQGENLLINSLYKIQSTIICFNKHNVKELCTKRKGLSNTKTGSYYIGCFIAQSAYRKGHSIIINLKQIVNSFIQIHGVEI